MTFETDFALPLLARINAPDTQTNLATLQGWTTHEKGSLANWAQWCNPLNTTEPYTGARDSGAQPGAHDVKIYRSLPDGIAATVITLTWEPGGRGTSYNAIVSNLRRSLPARYWSGDARSELDTWGTGAGWLDAVPLVGDSPSEQEAGMLFFKKSDSTYWIVDAAGKRKQQLAEVAQFKAAGGIYHELGNESIVNAEFIPTAPASVSVSVDNAAVLAALQDLKAHPAVLSDPALVGKVDALGKHLGLGTA